MDILTLELHDVTVSQAVMELNRVLDQHPELPLRVLLGGGETVLHNLLRFLERQQRKVASTRVGSGWQLDIQPLQALKPLPALQPIHAPALSVPAPRPVLLLRSAFTPGDRDLGRRLLLGVLRNLEPGTPWLALAHEALELLQDPQALEVLAELRNAGVIVRLSKESLSYLRMEAGPFEVMDDKDWQVLMGRGGLVLL